MTEVVTSLTPITTDGYSLSKFLFQLSFSDDSPASIAVLQAILSLASVYRHGNAEEPLRLKVASLGSLSASMNQRNIGTREIYQHVAVGMLICAFEIFLPSETSFQWPLYVSGAKSMLHEICDGGHPKLMEADLLILWVHYHDILARFTSKHWNTESAEKSSISKMQGMASSLASVADNQVLGIFGCSLEMINLIARMSEIKLQSGCPGNIPYAERMILRSIENDLLSIKQDTTSLIGTNPADDVNYGSRMSQLYRLAGLIYYERVLKDSSTSLQVTRWSDEAFDIMRQLKICDRPFPLFFVACEAHTDEQRDVILFLLERTQKASGHRRMHVVKGMIELMWVQLDLVSDLGETKYVDMLNVVISSNKSLPTLA
ncbi:fungal-specific transcription factor domain-containing protein [Penicillium longicatenatum]|uniref:fungal-specific transcription factor domain-containing protein n=1 Tax=Penicillium longicatenatum TaxID=1561947 RepID=UPI00254987BD|nr:fungal-specific transcription factor domain-containing protein [Penicillium longicatenatum]KAJ5648817.1 fungal-specific transcription factor domain-containing protein [Penicillium longicatenatum]